MNRLPIRSLLRRVRPAREAVLAARFGNLGRAAPLTEYPWDRGTPVDRWYIGRFLEEHASSVSGHVLEVKEDLYATALGATSVDVLDIDPTNAAATVVGDLCDPATLRGREYDAAIITQTLQLVAEPMAAAANVLAALRPGGVLLLSVPFCARLEGPEDLWRWTAAGLEKQLRDVLGDRPAEIESVGLGNGLAARAFLFGLVAEDLKASALAEEDPLRPLVILAQVRLLA